MYQTTPAAGPADLIDKIATAAAAAGWTVRRNNLVSTVRTVTLQKSGDNIHIWNDATGVYMRGSTGYDGGLPPASQPGVAWSYSNCNVGAGPFPNAVFFADNSPTEHFFAVVEVAAGRFRHLCFGELTKVGAYTGGTFYESTYWLNNGDSSGAHDGFSDNNHRLFDTGYGQNAGGSVRCDVDATIGEFLAFRRTDQSALPTVTGGIGPVQYGGNGGYRVIDGFYYRSINGWSAQTPLQRIQIRVERADAFWSVIGEVPNIRFLNMTRFAAGDEFTIGADTWKVFPFIRQGDSPGGSVYHQYSQQGAYAYKKVV